MENKCFSINYGARGQCTSPFCLVVESGVQASSAISAAILDVSLDHAPPQVVSHLELRLFLGSPLWKCIGSFSFHHATRVSHSDQVKGDP